MANFKFLRNWRLKASRKRGAAPLLPELFDPTGPARRVNRMLGAVALFGAFGTVALAVALTPGAQTSAPKANASQGASAISEVKRQATATETASPPIITIAALPQRAAKSDRLSLTPWAPRPRSVDASSDADRPGALPEADDSPSEAAIPGRDPEAEFEPDAGPDFAGPDFALGSSEPPPPGDTGAEAGNGTGDDLNIKPSAEAIDESSAEPSAEASLDAGAEAVTAIRTAPVKTDVNMRAGPDNAAAVIKVVPRNSNVEVIGCDYWCEVIYAGKRGWIYKGFLPGAKS